MTFVGKAFGLPLSANTTCRSASSISRAPVSSLVSAPMARHARQARPPAPAHSPPAVSAMASNASQASRNRSLGLGGKSLEADHERAVKHSIRETADAADRLRAPCVESARFMIVALAADYPCGFQSLRPVDDPPQPGILTEVGIGLVEHQCWSGAIDDAEQCWWRDPSAYR